MSGAILRKQLEGTTVGHWAVERYLGGGWYACECICGVKRPVMAASLNQGKSKSCGCMVKNLNALRKIQETEERKPRAPYKSVEKYE